MTERRGSTPQAMEEDRDDEGYDHRSRVLYLASLLSVGLIALDRVISDMGLGGPMEIAVIQFVKQVCRCQIHLPERVHVRKAHLGEDHQRSNG